MQNKHCIIQRLIDKDRDCMNELYDTYIHHIQRMITKSDINPIDHEKIITQLFRAIWSSPEILNKEKHISISITKLCLTLTKSYVISVR
ncbi:hypothetical protein [Guptibacillus hwajinpoensis]|uniref:RNA polymerase sigma-70 region 2 domain-containing protein n=1 Tax=Guptibacillus hwajinpoensis TaxID=208199 RepID=A0ABU0K3A8_9BACL|nr:hypothetical protein [Alkalihalobacillus hemicentroti]MDQ0483816.1 hypothetical protein [Alkalihalobacillus hemicentroti]